MNFFTFNTSLEVDSLASGCPYTISNGDGGKYSKDELLVEGGGSIKFSV
jgi:hypothetical protein